MGEFLEAFKVVEINEGGYVNDSTDRGGETYAGVSRKFFPNWPGWKIVDAHMPLQRGEIIDSIELKGMVKAFYKANFWDKIHGDSIDSQAVATFIYDWYVNSGQAGIKAIQKAMAIPADGVIGAITLRSINNRSEPELLQLLKTARIAFYQAIVAKDSTQKRFIKGWIARVERLA